MSADLLLARIKLTIYGARWNDIRRYRSNLPSNSVCYSAFRDRRNCLGGLAFLFREAPPRRGGRFYLFRVDRQENLSRIFRAGQSEKSRVFTRRDPRPRHPPRIAEGGYCQDFLRTQEGICAVCSIVGESGKRPALSRYSPAAPECRRRALARSLPDM